MDKKKKMRIARRLMICALFALTVPNLRSNGSTVTKKLVITK